ncbi:MAG: hypothetical protein LBD29_06115 [Treponema sp.]|nr:hypothetical protein [Treponema sp.]
MKIALLGETNGKGLGIFTAWILGLLAVSGALWFFTQPIRIRLLQGNVNSILAAMGYTQYLETPVPRIELPKGRVPLGTWYTLKDSKRRALVFAMMSEGIRFPCVAIVSDKGKVDEIIPLNTYVAQTLKRLPKGIIAAYIRRIEGDLPHFQEDL